MPLNVILCYTLLSLSPIYSMTPKAPIPPHVHMCRWSLWFLPTSQNNWFNTYPSFKPWNLAVRTHPYNYEYKLQPYTILVYVQICVTFTTNSLHINAILLHSIDVQPCIVIIILYAGHPLHPHEHAYPTVLYLKVVLVEGTINKIMDCKRGRQLYILYLKKHWKVR